MFIGIEGGGFIGVDSLTYGAIRGGNKGIGTSKTMMMIEGRLKW